MKPLREAVRPTTFIESVKMRDHTGLDVTIASETFQHTGSFKFRAGYNVALNVAESQLLTASSGNFGQALAYAARLLGKKCTVVMPATSAQVKIDAVRDFGATVDLIDVTKVRRGDRVAQLAGQMADTYVASAYDDRLVIDGNASMGDELAAYDFDAVIVPVGGGGLISGIIEGLRRNGSNMAVYGAEPLMANDAARSLAAGELIANEAEPMTLADGARTLSLGDLNWPIVRDGVAGIFEVPEDTIVDAMRLYFNLANLKCEPTGALSLAALLGTFERFHDQKICVIVSGGNVDAVLYASILERAKQTAP